MNIIEYLFGGMKSGRLFLTLVVISIIIGGVFYSTNQKQVNDVVVEVKTNNWCGFTPIVTSNGTKPTGKYQLPNESIRKGNPEDGIVMEKCNTIDKEYFFIVKYKNKTHRVQVSEKEYLSVYRGEPFCMKNTSNSKTYLSVIVSADFSKVNDMIISNPSK